MKGKFLNSWTIVLALAVLVGVLCNHFFLSGLLIVGTAVAIGLTVVGFIIDLVSKSSKGVRFTGFIFLFFATASVTSVFTIDFSRSRAEQQGDKIVRSIYQYKAQHGHFPKQVDSLDIDNEFKAKLINRNWYSTDSTLTQFELEVHSDGWHWTVFRSRDSAWVTED